MIAYVIRRVMYAIPILIGVNLITFTLFFVVNPPDNMARLHLGLRHVTDAGIEKWKSQHGYDKPLIINHEESGLATLTETVFFHKSVKLFVFDFGVSDNGRDISYDISQRMWPSLAIAVPSLIIALMVNISFALLLSFFRGSYIDLWGVVFCVMMMSISALFYYIGG
ncbi:MAG: ABC transporter permease, partial [Nitrospirales bacterium]